jgi:hypothetical protein
MMMKRDEGGELRPPRWELEEGSVDEVSAVLADRAITRAQAIKLGGAALLAGTGMLLFQSPADARKRHKKHRRRRRRKAQVAPVDPLQQVTGTPLPISLSVTNPGSTPLTISNVKLLGADGAVVDPTLPVTIAPGATATIPITVTYDPSSPLVDAGELRLFENGTPVTVTNGNTDGNVDLSF